MPQQWSYNISLKQLLIGALVILGIGFGIGILATIVFILFGVDWDMSQPSCNKGEPWPPSEAVVYKPLLIRVDADNTTETKNPFREKEIIAALYGKSHTIIVDCETLNPYWWSPDLILQLFHALEITSNRSDRFVPDFWIRKAISGNTNEVNETACQQLLDYAVNNSLYSFQGVLLEANQLLLFNTDSPYKNVVLQQTLQNLENSIDETKQTRGHKVGLLLTPDACYGVHKIVPKTALSKFDKIFYLENQMEIELSDGIPVVTTSLAYEHCARNLSGDVSLQLVLSDINNMFGNTDAPICIM